MDSQEDDPRQYWSEDCPYGDYLNAVDDYLELLTGRESNQSELQMIAELQEELCTPYEAAWDLARARFFRPWHCE